MFKFFAALRVLLALDRAHESLGAVVHDAIEKVIIPRLKKIAKASQEPEKYDALIADYREYANPSNFKSRVFSKHAEEIVEANARRYNRSAEDAETVAQDIATLFYTNPHEMTSFDVPRFDPETGPIGLVKYWRHVVNNKAMYAFRELVRKFPYETTEEGEDPFRTVSAPEQVTETDERMYEKIQSDLKDYVEAKIRAMGKKGEFLADVFKRWMQVVLDKGAELNVDRHLVEPIMREHRERGDSISRATVYNAVRTIKEMIEKFMARVREVGVEASARGRLHLSFEDVLIYEEFRKRVASWVLGK